VLFEGAVRPGGEGAPIDLLAYGVHEFLIEPEIMQGKQDGTEHFAAVEEMPDGSPGEVPTAGAIAAGVHGLGRIDVDAVAQA
jgi:hypothetical protein